jgi:L-arabinose isomerase
VIDFLKNVKIKKQQILTQNPQLKNVKKEAEEIVKQMDKSYAMANKIALQEKVYYEELYRRSQSNNSNDPCKKIVF